MDLKTLISTILTLLVATIMVGTVAAPIISDAQDSLYTDYSNLSTKWNMEEYGTDTSHTIILAGGSYLIDGVPYDYNESRFSYLVASDNFTIKNSASSKTSFVTSTTESGATYTSSDNVTIEIADGTITYTNGSTTRTAEYTWVMIPNHSGHYVIMESTQTMYLNSLNQITCVEGHGSTVYSCHNGVSSPAGGQLTATTQEVSGSEGQVLTATGIKIDTVDMDYLIVPEKVRYISDTNEGLLPLFDAILVMMILGGILLVAVRMVTKKA